MQLTEREIEIIHLRQLGTSFRVIGEEFGIGTERARQIYHRGLEKRQFNADVSKNWKRLESYCNKNGIPERDMGNIVIRLKRAGINSINDPRIYRDDILDRTYGLGEKYLDIVKSARYNNP